MFFFFSKKKEKQKTVKHKINLKHSKEMFYIPLSSEVFRIQCAYLRRGPEILPEMLYLYLECIKIKTKT